MLIQHQCILLLVSGWRQLIVQFSTFHTLDQRLFNDVVLCNVDERVDDDVAISR